MNASETLTLTNFESLVGTLTESERDDFYVLLLSYLTIAGRMIWSDEQSSQKQVIEGMKWLNEILDDVLKMVGSSHLRDQYMTDLGIAGSLRHYVSLAPHIESDISYALRSAYESLQRLNE